MIYRTRAAANRWWFAILLTLLGSYLVLNVILIASNYFTGDGITDAVIYTVTSSLKGAGISKYVLPFIGLLAALGLIFAVLARSLLRRKAKGSSVAYSLVAVLLALFSVGTTPAFQDISLLVKSQIVGDTADFTTYYKAPKRPCRANGRIWCTSMPRARAHLLRYRAVSRHGRRAERPARRQHRFQQHPAAAGHRLHHRRHGRLAVRHSAVRALRRQRLQRGLHLLPGERLHGRRAEGRRLQQLFLSGRRAGVRR